MAPAYPVQRAGKAADGRGIRPCSLSWRRCAPPSRSAAQAAGVSRLARDEARPQAAARRTGRGRDSMVILHVCAARDLRDGPTKRTDRASSAVWTANFLSFPLISFSESSFFKGLQQKLAPPSPSSAPMGEGQALDHPGRRAELDLRHEAQGTMTSGILEENVRVMFLRRLRRQAQTGQAEALTGNYAIIPQYLSRQSRNQTGWSRLRSVE